MPTWANHFRIADKLLPHIKTLDKEYFIIGNIAPDCGIPDSSHGIYVPPTGETHFTEDYYYSKKTDCNCEYIYNTYIKNETDIKKKSFFTGYYAHLFADRYYANELFFSIEKTYGDFRENEVLRKAVSKEKNNIDYLYFSENLSPSFELFKTYNGWSETYPEWYKNNEISRQMINIVKCYTENKPESIKYRYLTPKIMSEYADRVSGLILELFKQKGLL